MANPLATIGTNASTLPMAVAPPLNDPDPLPDALAIPPPFLNVTEFPIDLVRIPAFKPKPSDTPREK